MLRFITDDYLRTVYFVIEEVFKQFTEGCTSGFGEPQAWVEFDNRYILEITEEQDMIPEDEYFYKMKI